MFLHCEIEQVRQGLAVGETSVWISELVEVRVKKTSERCWSLLWIILQQLGYKVDCLSWSSVSEHLLPWQRPDLRESVFFVVWVHSLNLLFGRSSQDLNNLNQLIHTTFSGEYRLSKHQLCNHTPYRPNVNACCVI